MARDFDGVDDHVLLGDFPISEGQANLSMAAWVNLDTLGVAEMFFSKYSSATSRIEFRLSDVGTDGNIAVFIGNGANTGGATTSALLATATWTHIGFAFNGGGSTDADKLKVYINGVNQTLSFAAGLPTTTPSNTGTAHFGKRNTDVFFIDGRLAEFGVWQRALSADDFAVLAKKYAPSFFRRNLVFYTPLIREAIDQYRGTTTASGTAIVEHLPIIYPSKSSIGFSLHSITGTGALAAAASEVDAAGISSSTGTGALAAQASNVDGAGLSSSTGTGALIAGAAAVEGEGTVQAPAITGTGALVASASEIDGAGISASLGAGALAAQAADVDGSGTTASLGTGALVAGAATVDGTGTVVDEAITGTGALIAQAAAIDGAGVAQWNAVGALIAGAPVVVGVGITGSTGTGALEAEASSVAGVGTISVIAAIKATKYRPGNRQGIYAARAPTPSPSRSNIQRPGTRRP